MSAEDRLHRILSNLCDDAVQHGEDERVPVRVEIRAQPDPIGANPRIEANDSGPGVASEAVGEIFAPFISTNLLGTGLGRYIAEELSETNGVELEYIAQET